MRQFFSITVPMLSPSIFFVTVLSVIGSLQMFDLVYVMVGAHRARALPSTQTVIYLFYERAFVDNDRGYAAAIVFVLLLFMVALTASSSGYRGGGCTMPSTQRRGATAAEPAPRWHVGRGITGAEHRHGRGGS